MKAEDYAEAARLYRLAAERQPHNTKWLESLALVYVRSGEKEKLTEVLTRLGAKVVVMANAPLRWLSVIEERKSPTISCQCMGV